MKKQFTILLTLIFVLRLVPLNITYSITQNQIDSEVQIVCPDDYGNWYSGSGTIIDPKGIILTNKHVVTDQYGSIIDTCYIGFIESISQEPDFGTSSNRHLAEVKYYTTSSSMDAAILYLDNPTNKSYPYVNIWNSDSSTLQFGDEVEVIGFPSIGGSTITYTSGDFSGFGSSSDGTQNYLKTTAPLEHGNSGGASYNQAGKFIGIPTMVVAGTLNSLSYLLSVNSVKSWLSGILGSQYQQEVIEQVPIIEIPPVSIQNDITPPNISNSKIYYCDATYNPHSCIIGMCSCVSGTWFGQDGVNITTPLFYWKNITDKNGIKGYYVYFGNDINADPVKDGEFINIAQYQTSISKTDTYYLILKAVDNFNNISDSIYYEYLYNSLSNPTYGVPLEIYDYEGGELLAQYNRNPYLFTTAESIYFKWNDISPDGYYIKIHKGTYNSGDDKIIFVSNNSYTLELKLAEHIDINIATKDAIEKNIEYSNAFEITRAPKKKTTSLLFVRFEQKDIPNSKRDLLVNELDSYLKVNLSSNKYNSIKNDSSLYNYYKDKYIDELFPIKDILIGILYDERIFDNDWIKYNTLTPKHVEAYNYLQSLYAEKIQIKDYDKKINNQDDIINKNSDNNLINRLKGKILLQVEEHGEAWYIPPTESKRYYMKDGPTAYQMLRKFGLGITNADLEKIPIEGSNQTGNYSLVNRLEGYILLQVEEHGEAWYVNPDDGKRYYMRNGDEAYRIMRILSLGITNDDLRKIDIGEIE